MVRQSMRTSITYWRNAIGIFMASLGMPAAFAASQHYDYQRYITFKNDFNFQIYPVIQVPEDNCVAESKRVRRIIVNGNGHKGLSPGELLTVWIPLDDKEEITLKVDGKDTRQWANCWYRAGRVYIFGVDLENFEAAMKAKDANNGDQATVYDDSRYPSKDVECFLGRHEDKAGSQPGACYTGIAKASFAADVPAQLAEYTFDSDFPDPGIDLVKKTPVADTGIPMADIDVSNVDDLYLPIAASVYNHGATGYMGSAMELGKFKRRVQNFFCKRDSATNSCSWRWPIYSAYRKKYWLVNTFSNLVPEDLGKTGGNSILEHLPAGYNIINNTLGRPRSSNYFPGGDNINYLISGVNYNQSTGIPSNPVMQRYINRWMSWINGDPCANQANLIWPDNITAQFDKKNFCQKFRDNVREVWKHFLNDPVDGFNGKQGYEDKPNTPLYHNNALGFYSDCGLYDAVNNKGIQPPADGSLDALAKTCIIQHIVGYNSKVLDGALPGRVQAALRSVAYDPDGNGRQYQFDPFLTFAAPYDSQFNLDPFTRLIHSNRDGVGAVAYSFSIDDKYGNFRDASSGFIIDAGGASALENQAPYDPYQLYKAIWGYNAAEYSLVSLAHGVNPSDIQAQLVHIAGTHGNRALLIKQGDALSLLAMTAEGKWTLESPFKTLSDLRYLAAQEEQVTHGKEAYFLQLINHTFGEQSVFPKLPLDVNDTKEDAIAVLRWDTDTDWNLAKLKLYQLIDQKGPYQSSVNNWVKANLCGHNVDIHTAGGQGLAFPFVGGTYKPCDIELEDARGDKLILRLTPVKTTPKDTYTGANVEVWGLPHGKTPEGEPPTSHRLSSTDLQYCRKYSSLELVTLGTCDLIGVSANWTNDNFARDTVYMGLEFQNMPRVNLNLPAAPINTVDPEAVHFPFGDKISVKMLPDRKTVRATWPSALVKSGKPVKYELTLWNQKGPKQDLAKDVPYFQGSCAKDKDQNGQPINLQAYCDVNIPAIPAGGTSNWHLTVVGINYTADPQKQSDPLPSDTFNYPKP